MLAIDRAQLFHQPEHGSAHRDLSVAILQNLLAGRDPQLALLYVIVLLSLIFLGGGRFSLDAALFPRKQPLVSAPAAASAP